MAIRGGSRPGRRRFEHRAQFDVLRRLAGRRPAGCAPRESRNARISPLPTRTTGAMDEAEQPGQHGATCSPAQVACTSDGTARTARKGAGRSASVAGALAVVSVLAEHVPSRLRLGGDLVPLPANLVLDRLLTALDADELVANLAAAGGRADNYDHGAEQRRDHREHGTDDAIARRVRAEEMRDVHRRGGRVRREQHRADDAEREQVFTRDPLGAEDPAAPDQEHERQRRGEHCGAELETTAAELAVDDAAEGEIQPEPGGPEQPIGGIADAQGLQLPGLLEQPLDGPGEAEGRENEEQAPDHADARADS